MIVRQNDYKKIILPNLDLATGVCDEFFFAATMLLLGFLQSKIQIYKVRGYALYILAFIFVTILVDLLTKIRPKILTPNALVALIANTG